MMDDQNERAKDRPTPVRLGKLEEKVGELEKVE